MLHGRFKQAQSGYSNAFIHSFHDERLLQLLQLRLPLPQIPLHNVGERVGARSARKTLLIIIIDHGES